MHLTCPHCGFTEDVPDDRFSPETEKVSCPECRQVFSLKQDSAPPPGDVPPPEDAEPATEAEPATIVPWERRREIGFFKALWVTALGVVITPRIFYRLMNRSGGMAAPLWFAVIAGSVGTLASSLWGTLFVRLGVIALPAQVSPASYVRLNLILCVASPLVVVVSTYVLAAAVHYFMRFLAPHRESFESSFRVVAYANAVYLAAIIPVFALDQLGASLALTAVHLIVIAFGLAAVHRTTGLRAGGAVMMTLWAFFGVMLILATLLGTIRGG